MRIERVAARAFGPFTNESLELAAGLTVIAGPNEAGKTSWHAAIRAAVCGIRRGRGRATAADAAFEDRHRPWDQRDRWEVEARMGLDDGRTIEISQDLAGKVACRATDVGLGRDVSDEIMDGTPNASRWLGLDRDAFAATICVGQAEVASVANRETAASLQEHMQRAAATRGTDATAAEALARLAAFRREKVGLDRAGARGSLRAARTRLEATAAALAEARRRHADYLEAGALADASEREAAAGARRVLSIDAALARRVAAKACARVERAADLASRHPTPPSGLAARGAQADAVAGAIEGWNGRPRPASLAGPTSAELEAELAGLPGPPIGDTVPHASVIEARRRADVAAEALRVHGTRPDVDAAPPGPDELTLRRLAGRLRTPDPEPVPGLEAELAAAQGVLRGQSPVAASLGLIIAGAAMVAGLAVAIVVQPLLGAIVAIAGAGAATWAWQRRTHVARLGSMRVARAESALAPIRAAAEYAQRERSAASAESAASGLPADADALERLADRRAAAERGRAAVEQWDRQRLDLEARHRAARDALARALGERGVASDVGDPVLACTAYEEACRRRAEQALLADRAASIAHTLEARRGAEAAVADAQRVAIHAAEAVRAAARAIGVGDAGQPPERLVEELDAWRASRAEELRREDQALREWQELVGLLEGRSVEELRTEAEQRTRRAEDLVAKVAEQDLAPLADRPDLEALLAVEHEELANLQRVAHARSGAIEQIRGDLPDVAEAEEAVGDASIEMERVTELARVIDETLRLLRGAEERVHRDLAPILAAAIRRWLSDVTGGAYTDATVDPAGLSVQVKETDSGRWRPALLLSEGTREQIYLLLRIAMAQHLSTTGETAPLLLDEVTAQADRARATAMLEMLHRLSAERQVILFTHDELVAAWAERTLDGVRDRLIRLPVGAPQLAPALA